MFCQGGFDDVAEILVLFNGPHLSYPTEAFKGTVVQVINMRKVWVGDYNIW
jgi:hypothetical protein